MCGLAGYVLGANLQDPEGVLRAMGQALVHRGPDDGDQLFDPERGLGLVHRRLSIIDLSSSGRQPMVSSSGRYTLVYNGEVFNFESLRSELRTQPSSNGKGDSALVLEAFEEVGIVEALKRFGGMFALAVWDRHEEALVLARDTVGIKPLYYGWTPTGTFLFGSELKAVESHPHFVAEDDLGSLNLLLRFGNIPQPHSMYKGVYKLSPGHLLTLRLGESKRPESRPFRSPLDCAKLGWENPFLGNRAEAKEKVHSALKASVREHMVSDVPIGAFLSGGIDSSLVCALAQEASSERLKTFTIGFEDPAFNEAQSARDVANHLGTDHQELIFSSKDLEERVPKILSHLDEPFADSSYLATYLVSSMTKEKVTVSLSGDGGDELYGGYDRYHWAPSIWKRLGSYPYFLKHFIVFLGKKFSPKTWNSLIAPFQSWLPKNIQGNHFGSRVHRIAGLMTSDSPRDLYQRLMTHFDGKPDVLNSQLGPSTSYDHNEVWELREDFSEKMMLMDLLTYLSDDLLTKVDRASMAVGLESRVPLLTPDLVELAWSLPPQWRQGKAFLKEILSEYVPPELTNRPKKGFGVPLNSWLRGPLRQWAGDLLQSKACKELGYFDEGVMNRIWEDHYSGRFDRGYELWNLLSFLQWKVGRGQS